jgi:hypothetical protein
MILNSYKTEVKASVCTVIYHSPFQTEGEIVSNLTLNGYTP